MHIKNHHQATNIKFAYYLVTFLYLSAIAAGLYLEVASPKLYVGILTGLFVLVLFSSFQLKFNYLIYTDGGDKIIIRHYPLHPFHDKFKSIEIPKREFSHFELQKKILNLRWELILFQDTPKGMAKYPPISITALSGKSRKAILSSLTKYSKTKQN